MLTKTSTQTAARRVRVARILHERGPTPGTELAADLGLTPDQLWMHVLCDWFDVTPRGWLLTPQGKRDALAGTAFRAAAG